MSQLAARKPGQSMPVKTGQAEEELGLPPQSEQIDSRRFYSGDTYCSESQNPKLRDGRSSRSTTLSFWSQRPSSETRSVWAEAAQQDTGRGGSGQVPASLVRWRVGRRNEGAPHLQEREPWGRGISGLEETPLLLLTVKFDCRKAPCE